MQARAGQPEAFSIWACDTQYSDKTDLENEKESGRKIKNMKRELLAYW